MRVVLVIASALIAVQAYSVAEIEEKWADFKSKRGNHYYNYDEEASRKQVFVKNLQYIEEHNKKFDQGLVSFTLGVTKFADLTHDEYVQTLTGLTQLEAFDGTPFIPPANAEVPDAIDWRTKGAVTHVKDQQTCWSCWCFSAVGALEGQFFLKYGKLVSLSEQNLLDCTPVSLGCYGGSPKLALEYVRDNGGINTEDSYPYENQQKKCRYNPQNSAGKISGYKLIETGNEEDLKVAVATVGPISVSIDASCISFQFYDGGVHDNPNCTGITNHAVVVVGYGTTDDGKDYWLVKHSWGKDYGEKGYQKMARNNNNQCGFASYASYPVVV